MRPLTDDFLNSCKKENGFIIRGSNMTRIEVFVDAAFAFAVTMLVISIDQIPTNVTELIEVTKQIPAFIASVSLLMWIWSVHSDWSKRFGLEDGKTTFFSVTLIIIVLIFIYPLKIMAMGMFAWITSGFLPSYFDLSTWNELRLLFLYFASGFTSIFLLFRSMNRHVLSLKNTLRLEAEEVYKLNTHNFIASALVFIGLIAGVIPFLLPDGYVPFSGFVYALIGPTIFFIEKKRHSLCTQRNNAKI